MGVLRFVLVCVLLLMTGAGASAQDEDNSLFESAGPLAVPVGWRTLSQSCGTLGFDAAQLSTARTLYSGYRAAVKQTHAAGRRGLKELEKLHEGENPDWEKYNKERQKVSDQFVKELEGHEKSLMTDLRAVCSPAQEPRFVQVERARRREQGRVFTIAPGEALDLSEVLSRLRVARTPEIDGAVVQWEESLDKFLVERDRLIRKAMARDAELRTDPEGGEKERQELFGQFKELGQRIGDLNRRTATELSTMLPADAAETFTREIRVRTFPRIYGESRVSRAVKVAKARPDVSGEQKVKLDGLLSAYEADVAPINTRWAAAADEKFRTMGKDLMAELNLWGSQEESKEPFYVIRKERRAVDEKYVARVVEVLNEEQRGAVEKAEEKAAEHEFMPEYLPDVGKDFAASVKEWVEEDEEMP